jgi:hypothetical protein
MHPWRLHYRVWCRRPSGAIRFRCKACRKDFSVSSGTLFAYHKMPLRNYLAAIAIFVNEVKGKTALAISRDLDVPDRAGKCHWGRIRQPPYEFGLRRLAIVPARSSVFVALRGLALLRVENPWPDKPATVEWEATRDWGQPISVSSNRFSLEPRLVMNHDGPVHVASRRSSLIRSRTDS